MPLSVKIIPVLLLAVCLSGSGLHAQSGKKNQPTRKTQKPVSEGVSKDTGTVVIPMEESFKANIKKQSKVEIVPAKALQGSEPVQPSKPIPKK